MLETVSRLPLLPTQHDRARFRIAMLAPPWIPVPPTGYGGIEAVVSLLCEALVARGHDVTLFAAPGSRSSARVLTLLPTAHPHTIGSALQESDYVAGAFEAIDQAADRGEPFDVIHDHCGFTALAMASRVSAPVVHTLHGPFVGETAGFYQRHGHKARLVAISHSQRASAPAGVDVAAVVPNPIAINHWPFQADKDDYLLWIGRMDPTKGAHSAIEAARLAGRPLVLAGPVQTGQEDYFHERIAPHIDDQRVRYVGEISGAPEKQLYAHAAAMLMPIRWNEPFGMVMVEALACGTPVIAFAEGAAKEIVIDGDNGMLVADEAAMARAIAHVHEIDPARCRESARSRYDVAITTDGYEAVYDRAKRVRTSFAASRDDTPLVVSTSLRSGAATGYWSGRFDSPTRKGLLDGFERRGPDSRYRALNAAGRGLSISSDDARRSACVRGPGLGLLGRSVDGPLGDGEHARSSGCGSPWSACRRLSAICSGISRLCARARPARLVTWHASSSSTPAPTATPPRSPRASPRCSRTMARPSTCTSSVRMRPTRRRRTMTP